MKNYKYKFFIFIASLIIGFLASNNFNINSMSNLFKMNAQEYKNASEERNMLYESISDLKEENYNLQEQYNSYINDETDSANIVDNMSSQLNDYYTIGGLTEVEGPGIVVKIEDGDYDINSDSQEEVNRRTLHDIDVAMVINELRYIGAEAIALNSYRILNNTGVTCNWAFIGFEDESMEMAPFYFYAIGNPEQLEIAIKAEGSYINELIIRKLKVEVNVMESITVLPTKKSYDSLYMHRNDK